MASSICWRLARRALRSPRGSRGGLQGRSTARRRASVPAAGRAGPSPRFRLRPRCPPIRCTSSGRSTSREASTSTRGRRARAGWGNGWMSAGRSTSCIPWPPGRRRAASRVHGTPASRLPLSRFPACRSSSATPIVPSTTAMAPRSPMTEPGEHLAAPRDNTDWISCRAAQPIPMEQQGFPNPKARKRRPAPTPALRARFDRLRVAAAAALLSRPAYAAAEL